MVYDWDELEEYGHQLPSRNLEVLAELVGCTITGVMRWSMVPWDDEMLAFYRADQLFSLSEGAFSLEFDGERVVSFWHSHRLNSVLLWQEDEPTLASLIHREEVFEKPAERLYPLGTGDYPEWERFVGQTLASWEVLVVDRKDPTLDHQPNEAAVVVSTIEGGQFVMGNRIEEWRGQFAVMFWDDIDPGFPDLIVDRFTIPGPPPGEQSPAGSSSV